jgi:hypothetical protein
MPSVVVTMMVAAMVVVPIGVSIVVVMAVMAVVAPDGGHGAALVAIATVTMAVALEVTGGGSFS